ncbi:proteasome subunit alpha [Kutzneria buriramensis]|uniref:Proteasome subunit alpha n=1 Tax=Kutzneria buriramensis TaxID=1045776 RepID=A0A3E0H082_9PSEU|nr:proteasome subunit alpha [Kutzneria buriramensis]REH35225.1 proteasome alpha subunit [Kutzneria buriramensis]
MTLPLYASAEQVMRDRSELARKGIAKGRSVVVLTYTDGVLFVAENTSSTLRKVSEIYDRIGFAAVGRYSEFESLRVAGVRHADLRGYQYDRRDVNARSLANAFAGLLGSIFTEQIKPFEVEVCLAEVGASYGTDQLYRLTYDGSIFDEPKYVVMGGQADAISAALKDSYQDDASLADTLRVAVNAFDAGSPATNSDRSLEVAVLDRKRPRRAFRRIQGTVLAELLDSTKAKPEEPAAPAEDTSTGDSGKES